jgi:hypothetical protein
MPRTLTIAMGVTLGCVAAGPVAAGDAAVASLPRVRVLAPTVSGEPIVGQLLQADEATFTLRRTGGGGGLGWPFHRADAATLSLPRESVARFERSVRPSRKRHGAKVGALIGFGVGIGAGVAYCNGGSRCEGDWGGAVVLASMLIAAPAGYLLGAALSPGERWAAEDPKKVRVGFTPAPGGGVGVRLSLRF